MRQAAMPRAIWDLTRKAAGLDPTSAKALPPRPHHLVKHRCRLLLAYGYVVGHRDGCAPAASVRHSSSLKLNA
jgi:hypothetical protein